MEKQYFLKIKNHNTRGKIFQSSYEYNSEEEMLEAKNLIEQGFNMSKS